MYTQRTTWAGSFFGVSKNKKAKRNFIYSLSYWLWFEIGQKCHPLIVWFKNVSPLIFGLKIPFLLSLNCYNLTKNLTCCPHHCFQRSFWVSPRINLSKTFQSKIKNKKYNSCFEIYLLFNINKMTRLTPRLHISQNCYSLVGPIEFQAGNY